MTEWVTIKVPESDREQAEDYKPEGATWGDVVVAGAERLNDHTDSDTRAYLDGSEGVDVDALADVLTDRMDQPGGAEVTVDGEVVGTLESIEASLETVEYRTGSIERTLEGLQR